MKLGVFGGSFDPVHLGHLILAEQCREQAQLDRVLFVPAARPPHKTGQILTPFHHRVEMLALAISGNPAFAVDELESEREGPSYTAVTLETLQSRDGDDLWLILGGDSLVDLPLWYRPQRILELAGILVVGRPGSQPPDKAKLAAELKLPADVSVRLEAVQSPLIDIASRDLRAAVQGRRSIRYRVPAAVEAYIHDKALYRT